MGNPHHRKATQLLIALVAAALLALPALPAQAVIVRGTVTTPFGVPLGNARIQLIQGQQVAAFAYTLQDGTYEVRSSANGRFVLLTSAAPYTPSVGQAFYGGRTAVVTRNIVMEFGTVTPQLTVTATGVPTPIQQLPAGITLIPQSALTTQIGVSNDLRQSPGSNVVQTGQAGGPISLYVRGGSPDANKVLTDGVPSEDIGGYFNYGPVSTTALTGPELYRGANSALYGTGAEAGIVNLGTTRSRALRPVLNYTGDAGNFHTYRNEAIVSGAIKALDYLGAFSRFNTSNALPLDEYHSTNEIANIGYAILTNTTARLTFRNTDSSTGLPSAHDIYGISSSGKQSNQDIYSGLTVDNVLAVEGHNLVRYGIARKREQVEQFAPTGEPVTVITNGTPQTTYYGDLLTINGANGYTATGQAAILSPTFDTVSNRDDLHYQSDYTFPSRTALLFGFQYESERGRRLDAAPPNGSIIKRTNYLYTLQVQGDIKHRLFYSAGGALENNELYGIAGQPRIGLTYDAVRPGHRPFHGTLLRFNVATGIQEPSQIGQLTSPYTSPPANRQRVAGIAAYNVTPIAAERSRTYDIAVDQNILNQKLILKAGYFHNQFNHQLEFIAANGLERYFGVLANIATELLPASLNSLAYRAQGLETEVQYQPFNHLLLRGGYTYLRLSGRTVLLDLSAVAAADGTPITNPNLPWYFHRGPLPSGRQPALQPPSQHWLLRRGNHPQSLLHRDLARLQ